MFLSQLDKYLSFHFKKARQDGAHSSANIPPVIFV